MPYSDETLSQPPRPRFDSTQWSLVLQSRQRGTSEGQAALADLCQRYWYPLFAYVRCLGYDMHQAQDLTQGFFERLIEKNYVGDADASKGKFRTFLLTSLTHFLANEHDKRTAQKRGGTRKQLSLDLEDAERRFAIEPSASETPEARYEEQWARSLLDRVVGQLQKIYIDAGKSQLFENLKQYLVGAEVETAGAISKRLGMSESAVRVAAHRLRTECRSILRAEIAATVADPSEINDEIAALFAAFSPKK